MARIVAIDFGERRIGLATGDDRVGVATGLETITTGGRRDLRSKLEELVREREPDLFVVGYPLNMDGSRGEMCGAVEVFAERLKGWFGLPVVLWDERLSSAEAERIRSEAGTSSKDARSKGLVDRAAAVLILQSWFDSTDRSGIRRVAGNRADRYSGTGESEEPTG